MSYIFNYIDFHNYYINPSNVITDTNDCVSLYYFTDSDKIKKVRKSNPKCTHIIVNGIKIYITNDNKKMFIPMTMTKKLQKIHMGYIFQFLR